MNLNLFLELTKQALKLIQIESPVFREFSVFVVNINYIHICFIESNHSIILNLLPGYFRNFI